MKSALCILAACTLCSAAGKPNFSGEWKMNSGKSAFGPIPPPASLVRKIAHSEPSLTIVEEQKGGAGDHVVTRPYTTDGKPVTFQEDAANIVATATWQGDALVIISKADTGGAAYVFTERMTLSGEKTLIDAIHIETPQGEVDAIYSFDKQ
jgi:hypothetical protein